MSKEYNSAPNGYRVRPGDSVGVLAWSNVAFTLRCNISFLRDGERDPTTLNPGDTTVTSNRAVSAGSLLTFTDPGVIQAVSCAGLGGGATQRGQTFVEVVLTGSGSAVGVYQTLFQGYVYTGNVGALGQIVEPGPAGGHGAQTRNALAAPAAGVDYADLAAPAGVIWRPKGFRGQLVTGAGVANREFSILYLNMNGTAVTGGGVASEIQTATLTNDYVGTQGTTSAGVSASLGGGVISVGLGDFLMVLQTTIRFKTFNIQAADQWSTGEFQVEEWVMPN